MNEALAGYLSLYGVVLVVSRLVIVGAILVGLWVALRRTMLSDRTQKEVWFAVAVPLVVWLATVWSLAAGGAFQAASGVFPAIPIALVLPVLIGLFALMRSQPIALAIDAASPSWLIGLQAYRVLGGNFVVLWSFGVLPGAFALPAGLGDMLVGLLALPVAFCVASAMPGARMVGVAWNILGIADLVLAIALGVLSSAGPLQLIALNQPNMLASYPAVMTPAFAVPLSLILHGLSLWQLRRQERLSVAAAR